VTDLRRLTRAAESENAIGRKRHMAKRVRMRIAIPLPTLFAASSRLIARVITRMPTITIASAPRDEIHEITIVLPG
jgi:hypothetical protein